MKIVMLAGGGGSGGLMAYLCGILSVKTAYEILFFCTPELQARLGNVAENIQICATPFARESGKDILLNKPLDARLVAAVDAFSPDVVLFMNGWIRRGLEKYPNVMILHNQLYVDDTVFRQTASLKLLPSLLGFRRIVRRSMQKTDGVLFLSEKSMRDAQKNRVKFKRGAVVYFGIPENDVAAAVQEKTQKDIYKLLYVSSFYAYKNHDALLEAIAILKNKGCKLQMGFIGAGPAFREQQLMKKVKDLSLEKDVLFHGSQPHDKVLEAMDAADVFVYPSAVESTGLGVMEAMARGMCIACSNKSCMPEVLKDAGIYFNPDRPCEIAEAIEKLIGDEQTRNALAQKAISYAKVYTWVKAVEETCAFLENTVKGD